MKKLLPIFLLVLAIISPSCQEDDLDSNFSIIDLSGVWKCEENSSLFKSTNTNTYEVTIRILDKETGKIRINNFYHLGREKYIDALINGQNIILNKQKIDQNTIDGNGDIYKNGNKIRLTYNVVLATGQKDIVEATYTQL